jgi:hypothetical protein
MLDFERNEGIINNSKAIYKSDNVFFSFLKLDFEGRVGIINNINANI